MKIELPIDTGQHLVIGVGAETNTTLCHAAGRTAVVSEPYNDLRDANTLDVFEKDLSLILERAGEVTLACDLHPQYVTTALAQKISGDPGKVIRVQHHHAHVASAMADHCLHGEVIGLAFDGTGYGEDGATWGMEFLVAGAGHYRRVGHLAYTPMPGGDMAVKEPYRMAISHLYGAFGDTLGGLGAKYEQLFGMEKITSIIGLVKRGIHSPPTSSCGRLFDAVASMLGICHISEGKAEGPRGLEELADKEDTRSYGYTIRQDGGTRILDLSEAVSAIVAGLERKTNPAEISARFHNTVAYASADIAGSLSEETGIKKVVLSGGVFMNRLLRQRLTAGLSKSGLEAVVPRRVPVTDAGISLGQVYIAINKMINI